MSKSIIEAAKQLSNTSIPIEAPQQPEKPNSTRIVFRPKPKPEADPVEVTPAKKVGLQVRARAEFIAAFQPVKLTVSEKPQIPKLEAKEEKLTSVVESHDHGAHKREILETRVSVVNDPCDKNLKRLERQPSRRELKAQHAEARKASKMARANFRNNEVVPFCVPIIERAHAAAVEFTAARERDERTFADSIKVPFRPSVSVQACWQAVEVLAERLRECEKPNGSMTLRSLLQNVVEI